MLRYADQVEVMRQMRLPGRSFWDPDLYAPLETLFFRACSRRVRVRFMKVWFRDFSPPPCQLSLFPETSSTPSKKVPLIPALDRIREDGDLEPVIGPIGNGPARYYRYPGAPGTVGAISPMSHNFCEGCNRLRLTADGQLRPCLFGTLQTNLRDPLRQGADLRPLIEETLRIKPERHYLVQGSEAGSGGLIALSQTGG